MTLSEFLMARIAEDEQAARAATPGPWKVYNSRHDFHDGSFCEAWGVETSDDARVVEVGHDRDYGTPEAACEREGDAAHIARHDPARVLAECEAKRRIAEAAVETLAYEAAGFPSDEGTAVEEAHGLADYTLRALALPYAGHEAYDERWKP